MVDENTVSRRLITTEEVQHLAAVMDLELTDDRKAQLVETLSKFLKNVEGIRQIDTQNAEPPVLTYDRDVAS